MKNYAGSEALPTLTKEKSHLGPTRCLKFKGLTASQVIRLIGLSLVFASQKKVHNVRNEMAESIVPMRKKS